MIVELWFLQILNPADFFDSLIIIANRETGCVL
jgi:hypothetical protein